MKRYAQMKKIIEFFNSPKISRMGEYMLTGRYIMVLFALASVFVIFDISVAGVLTFACITGITLVLCEDLLAPFPPFLFLCLIGTKCYNSFSVFIQYKALGVVLIICVIMHFVFTLINFYYLVFVAVMVYNYYYKNFVQINEVV